MYNYCPHCGKPLNGQSTPSMPTYPLIPLPPYYIGDSPNPDTPFFEGYKSKLYFDTDTTTNMTDWMKKLNDMVNQKHPHTQAKPGDVDYNPSQDKDDDSNG